MKYEKDFGFILFLRNCPSVFWIGHVLQPIWNKQGPGWEWPRHWLFCKDSSYTFNHQQCCWWQDITPQRAWSWNYGSSPTWAKQKLDETRLLLKACKSPDQTAQATSALLSHLQATQMPLDAEVSTSLSKPLKTSYTTFRERMLIFFFFPRRSLSICFISLYLLASAHRRFLEHSHSQQTEKRKEETLFCFLLAPWCIGMKPEKKNSVLDKPSIGIYFTVPVVQLQFTWIQPNFWFLFIGVVWRNSKNISKLLIATGLLEGSVWMESF